ncbi:uncharacterized protein M6B38_402875 [Iris pallida]|uniref:Tyrosine-specific transport protein n=1 Tax=Iris pallida TaxID=29817 RepID=A0AAX6FSP7_IRIPA|nr:uncharacterized protein M6B38_402875 [Iris pallida]
MSSMYSSSSYYYSNTHLFHRTILHPLQYRHPVELSPCFKAKQYGALRCRDGKKLEEDAAMASSNRKLSVATAAKWSSSSSDGSSSSTKGSESEKKGTILGAVSLIVGTSIGSGILALPQRTSPAGFMPSAIAIMLCWVFLVIEALLIAEINVHLRRKLKKDESQRNNGLEVLSLRTMAQETLGEWGGNLAATTYLFLAYTSVVAYTSKSGELLSHITTLPASTSGIIFTLTLALLISVGGTDITDQVNQWLTVTMIGLLLGIEVLALSFAGGSSAPATSNWEEIPQAIPVIIFSLVFHDIAPVICAYLGGDITRVRTSIVLGSLVPLLSLLVWNYIALSLPHKLDSIDTLEFLARGRWIDTFSILAVGTSLIGTLLGFSQFFLEQLVNLSNAPPLVQTWGMSEGDVADSVSENQQSRDSQKNWWERNILTFLATSMAVLPSMLISTIVPDAFSAATDFAGGYCMTILYGVLPPVMAWSLQHSRPATNSHKCSEEIGLASDRRGTLSNVKPILIGVGLFSCGIVMDQVFQDLTLLHLQ